MIHLGVCFELKVANSSDPLYLFPSLGPHSSISFFFSIFTLFYSNLLKFLFSKFSIFSFVWFLTEPRWFEIHSTKWTHLPSRVCLSVVCQALEQIECMYFGVLLTFVHTFHKIYKHDIIQLACNAITVRCPGIFQGEFSMIMTDDKRSLFFVMLASNPDLEFVTTLFKTMMRDFPQYILFWHNR